MNTNFPNNLNKLRFSRFPPIQFINNLVFYKINERLNLFNIQSRKADKIGENSTASSFAAVHPVGDRPKFYYLTFLNPRNRYLLSFFQTKHNELKWKINNKMKPNAKYVDAGGCCAASPASLSKASFSNKCNFLNRFLLQQNPRNLNCFL